VSKVNFYRAGQDRNEDRALTHTYAETVAGNLFPMCGYGWNRSNGTRLSIFRGSPGTEGDCLICRRNVAAGKRPVHRPWPHKTKWL
jgi:hypothetical protein